MRWLTPPPQRTAYFSSARSPGVVLRVSRTVPPVPSRASTQRRVSVATPERWHSRLSAVRSAVSRSWVGAVTRGDPGTRLDQRAVGDELSNSLAAGPHTISMTAAATGRPAIDASRPGPEGGRADEVEGDGRGRGDVDSVGQVLVERSAHEPLDRVGVETR